MDAMTSVLSTENLLVQDRDGKLRRRLFSLDSLAFRVWAHGVEPRRVSNQVNLDHMLTQTITLSIGVRTDESSSCLNCGSTKVMSTMGMGPSSQAVYKCADCGVHIARYWTKGS